MNESILSLRVGGFSNSLSRLDQSVPRITDLMRMLYFCSLAVGYSSEDTIKGMEEFVNNLTTKNNESNSNK